MANDIEMLLRNLVSGRTFLARYPLYAHVLGRLRPILDPAVPVMAVSSGQECLYLHVNLDFFLGHQKYVSGVLLHEVHHVVLGHLSDPQFSGAAYPDLMELAMEISANEYIAEPLPGRPVQWRDFAACGVRPHQSTLERYARLAAARNRGDEPLRMPLSSIDSHLAGAVGGGINGCRRPYPTAQVLVRELIARTVAETEAFQPLGRGLLAGRTPGELLEELHDSDRAPTRFFDWKTAIEIFVTRMRTPAHTYCWPSRRFRTRVGEIPGRRYHSEIAGHPRLLVAIDTSSSMSRDELEEIARQLRVLGTLVEITVVECDADIQRVYPFDGKVETVAGRGGTDLRPVFARSFVRTHRPDGIVYFTDGIGPYPHESPGVNTLWVLTKPVEFGCPWGEKASMSPLPSPVAYSFTLWTGATPRS